VWKFFYNLPNAKIYIFCTSLIMTLSFWMDAFYLKVWAILFLFLFSFLHALWHAFFLMPFGMDILLFLFFSVAHTSFWHIKNFRERLMMNE
jgi:hypothetical protein